MGHDHDFTQNILLGITGGIAAYKSAEIVRRLQDKNCRVKVIMTATAEQFVGPLTFQALTGEPVYTSLFQSHGDAMEHIQLARWADKILIAPASANFLGKLANGLADDLLSTTCLAAEAPIFVAPAMNQAMWANQATQANMDILAQRHIQFLGPESGSQACGETGAGRMLEPDEIVAALTSTPQQILADKTVVITAGPTQEPIDPVRFISNHSSGKMGYALAAKAQALGAKVILISGPTQLAKPKYVEFLAVQSAQEMHNTVMQHIQGVDIFIACAAVADYRPTTIEKNKLKKHAATLTIEMERNPDILADVCQLNPKPFCIGFAAETENLIEHAQQKQQSKNADLIVANPVGKDDQGKSLGFNADDNHAYLISATKVIDLGKQNKTHLAELLLQHITESYEKRHSS